MRFLIVSQDSTTLELFSTIGAYATGKISEEERVDVVRNACPGSGACGGMFT
jgi:dihydroxy-acid dehydratase